MGLDMSLTAKRFIYGTDRKKLRISGIKGVHQEKVQYIIEECLTWRKANQIHKWFVDEVQDGKDDCKSYFVSRDQLIILMELCKMAIASRGSETCMCLKKDILPGQEGFFFGSTDKDEYYWEDIDYTIKGIDRLLKDYDNHWGFEYHSSW